MVTATAEMVGVAVSDQKRPNATAHTIAITTKMGRGIHGPSLTF
jgi:hypothetical protein